MTALYDIAVTTITGQEQKLATYQNQALLIVNVASKCGLTPQYEGLQKVYRQYRDKGLVVLGFPANNFLAQEPGTDNEIQEFCTLNYQVGFPMFSKISVKGDDQHPLYAYLCRTHQATDVNNGGDFESQLANFGQMRQNPEDVLWNFEKFLISQQGEIVARIAPDVAVEDPRVLALFDDVIN